MNLEQLQGMSDAELNELSAVKVMGWKKVESELCDYAIYETGKGFHKDYNWNPTTDMNDAMELTKWADDPYKRHVYVETLRKAQGWHTDFVGNDIMFALIHATPGERTIASILAKEE